MQSKIHGYRIAAAHVELRQSSEEQHMKSIPLAILFVTLAAMSPAAARIPQQDTLRADVNVVSIYFTVQDKREHLVTDLPKDVFKVFEDGKPQQISFFAHHSDVPMNVGVLLDTSTAMARTLGLEADAASRFFRTVMRPNDQGFLVSYAAHIDVLQVPIEDADVVAHSPKLVGDLGSFNWRGTRVLLCRRRPSRAGAQVALLAKLKLVRWAAIQRASRGQGEASFARRPSPAPRSHQGRGKAGILRILRSAAQALH